MKFLCLLSACLASAVFALAETSETLPEKASTLALLERVADWQLDHPPKHSTTDWTRAAFYDGAMALAKVSDSPRFLEAMLKVGEGNEWKLGPRLYHADDHAVGQMYAEMYLLKHDAKMIAPMQASFDQILANPKEDDLSFNSKNPVFQQNWSWCDALFMSPPAWIRLWKATGKGEYLKFAVDKWWVTSNYLYDKEEHLYFRDDTYFKRREANGKKVFWSRGNGWVMGGLVRMLQYLPPDHPARPRFVQQYQEMAEKLLTVQQSDGLWRSSLLDPENYPLKETSGTGFYTYALAWGVNEGLLDAAKFKPVALKGWQGLVSCVDADGKLTHVQPIGADPKKFSDDATEVYGVGAFLLAGTEILRLAGK